MASLILNNFASISINPFRNKFAEVQTFFRLFSGLVWKRWYFTSSFRPSSLTPSTKVSSTSRPQRGFFCVAVSLHAGRRITLLASQSILQKESSWTKSVGFSLRF